MSAGPLDVMLCPGCLTEVEWERHDGYGDPFWSCHCEECDYSIAETSGAPFTIRNMIDGSIPFNSDLWSDVNLEGWTREICLRLLREATG